MEGIKRMAPEKAEYTARDATEADLPAIEAFFKAHDYGPQKLEWLKWKLMDNPDGPAYMFVVENSKNEIVCYQARLPRRFRSEHTGTFVPRQEVDTLITPSERGKKHLRTLGNHAGPKRDYLGMGFPNQFYRSKLTPGKGTGVVPMVNWLFPLTVGRLIEDKPYRFFGPLVNVFSNLYALCWLGTRPKNIEMRPVTRFERDYELDQAYIHGDRSADYLNWRFIDNPMRSYSAYEFFAGGENIGYCVYAEVESSVEIFDIVTDRRHTKCMRLLADHCREKGFPNMSFRCAGFDLKEFGFLRRGAPNDFMISDARNGPFRPHGAWRLTLTDSDY